MTILTEAATGAYGVTPITAALAGASKVYAFTKSSRHGTGADATEWTRELASKAGVSDQVKIIYELTEEVISDIDIVTNSGHLRPITSDLIEKLRPGSVV